MAEVVSFGDRLKLRRAELGLSQAQAARELDVARTAYRLWEMEAAKPAPDRWRLLSRWLGVSVTTMLLADDLITEAEASAATTVIEADFVREPDRARSTQGDDFFKQGRALIEDGTASGSITREQADELRIVLDRLQEERQKIPTVAWAPGELRKAFRPIEQTPRAAREAVSLVAGDIPGDALETARLLTSELVTNSVKYGPAAPASIGLFIDVARERIRIEVSDAGDALPHLSSATEDGCYGLKLVEALATRWHTDRDGNGNLTWFELDLPAPGA